jgi:hypothetical protein
MLIGPEIPNAKFHRTVNVMRFGTYLAVEGSIMPVLRFSFRPQPRSELLSGYKDTVQFQSFW